MIRIAVATALLLAATAPPAFAQDGEQTYKLQCALCHDDEALGPSLVGVHERKIASGTFEYSDALKAKNADTWTDANLDAFLKDPNAFAAGSKMSMSVSDDAARAAVIAYLKTLK